MLKIKLNILSKILIVVFSFLVFVNFDNIKAESTLSKYNK